MTVPLAVEIVGAGLIGTSLGLALVAKGHRVVISDRDEHAVRLAEALGVPPHDPDDVSWSPDVVVVCVPPSATPVVAIEAQRRHLRATVTSTSSIMTKPQVEAETLGLDQTRWLAGHPLAGREKSGAAAATPDLFRGRPWVLASSTALSAARVELVEAMVRATGATPVVMDDRQHDVAVALVSHAPQVVASLMAGRLVAADADAVAIAGQGLRDVTRIASSDADLWVDILSGNAGAVLPVLDALSADLDELREALAAASKGDESTNRRSDEVIRRLLVAGADGQERIPGKHGTAHTTYATVPVVLSDQPGELARLFVAAGEADVNIEDVSIEHAPGQAVGLVELAVRPESVATLADALRDGGWSVHLPHSTPTD